jgi:hypothetical protein
MDLSEFKMEIDAAMQCLEQFLVCMNAQDLKGYESCFNFPSYRLASNTVRVIEPGSVNPERFKTGAFEGWARSAWDKRDVIHAGRDKVHINTRFVSYRADGSVLGAFDSIYIVTKENDHWGIKFRSSFAP